MLKIPVLLEFSQFQHNYHFMIFSNTQLNKHEITSNIYLMRKIVQNCVCIDLTSRCAAAWCRLRPLLDSMETPIKGQPITTTVLEVL